MSDGIAVYEQRPLAASDLKEQVNLIQDVMKAVMKDGEHYGKIPGCGDKPSLLQPGAQKLIMTFRLVPDAEVEVVDLFNATVQGHREYRVKVKMYAQNGVFLGSGVGSCNTMEKKYRFRTGHAELTTTPVPQEYWTFRKEDPAKALTMIGGPGHSAKKNEAGQWVIAIQGDPVEHDNPADYYNTCEKMAYKRALVSATLTVTAASDIFTQDVEEMVESGLITPKPEAQKPPVQQPQEKRAPNNTAGATIKDPSAQITDGQVKAIGAILSKLGIQDEMARHEKVSNILALDNVITSMRSLNIGQASEVIQTLQKEANG